MSKTFKQGREEVVRLCKYFADNRQDFFTAGIKDARVRKSLIEVSAAFDMLKTIYISMDRV